MKTVFVASSRKYYDKVKEIKRELDKRGIKCFYPYFGEAGSGPDNGLFSK